MASTAMARVERPEPREYSVSPTPTMQYLSRRWLIASPCRNRSRSAARRTVGPLTCGRRSRRRPPHPVRCTRCRKPSARRPGTRGRPRSQRAAVPALERVGAVGDVPSSTKSRPSPRICAPGRPRERSTNCGRNARKNSAVLGFRMLTTTPSRKARRSRRGRPLATDAGDGAVENPAHAEVDEIGRAQPLHRGEGGGGGDQHGRESDRRGRHVHQRADVHAEHRDEPGPPALVDAAGHDVEHGRARA